MTPNQLQRFLDEAGMSQRGAARELGIGERTMRRYVAGELPVPRPIELALRYLQRYPTDLDSLSAIERDEVKTAQREIRALRPGKRPITPLPLRNALGEFVEVRFMWADCPGRLLAGRAIQLPDGKWQTEVR
jgi:hypothetical protein